MMASFVKQTLVLRRACSPRSYDGQFQTRHLFLCFGFARLGFVEAKELLLPQNGTASRRSGWTFMRPSSVAREPEAVLACNMLHQLTPLGRATSYCLER